MADQKKIGKQNKRRGKRFEYDVVSKLKESFPDSETSRVVLSGAVKDNPYLAGDIHFIPFPTLLRDLRFVFEAKYSTRNRDSVRITRKAFEQAIDAANQILRGGFYYIPAVVSQFYNAKSRPSLIIAFDYPAFIDLLTIVENKLKFYQDWIEMKERRLQELEKQLEECRRGKA